MANDDVRLTAPMSTGTALGGVRELAPDPVRFEVDVTLSADDVAYLAASADAVLTLGPFKVTGSANPILLTLSRASVALAGA